MKEKWIGLISVAAIATSIILTFTYLFWEQTEENMNAGLMFGGRLTKSGIRSVPSVDSKSQKTIRKLQSKLKKLRVPGLPQRGQVDFEMLGYELSKARNAQQDDEGEMYDDFNFNTTQETIVSMTYMSGKTRYAVINGNLLKEGDTFDNKEFQVKTITPHKVLIVGKGSSRWIKTSNLTMEQRELRDKKENSNALANKKKNSNKPNKPKTAIEQITQGLSDIKSYSNTLKSLE